MTPQQIIRAKGTAYRKKHGSWYVVKTRFGDFVLDTWNDAVLFYPDGAERSGDDVYGNVVCWYGERFVFA